MVAKIAISRAIDSCEYFRFALWVTKLFEPFSSGLFTFGVLIKMSFALLSFHFLILLLFGKVSTIVYT